MRICLVGCGSMAMNAHGPMLQKYARMRDGIVLAGCCDVSIDKAQSLASEFGFAHAYSDIDDMLDCEKPEGAVLVVPIERTAQLAIRILKRRIPLLTEKPPGVTLEEGKAIAIAAEKAGVPACVAFNRRSMPLLEELMREIDDIGESIDSISAEMCRANRAEPDFSMTAIHDIDLVRFICHSDYREALLYYREHREAAPAADILLHSVMESGAQAELGFYPMCGCDTERITVRLHGHLLRLALPVYDGTDNRGRMEHYAGNSLVKSIEGKIYDHHAEANGFLGEHTFFFDALLEGRDPAHSVKASLQSLEVACCIAHRESIFCKGET